MTTALGDSIAAKTSARLDDPRPFDAIVVGAGAAGGMAAMLLTQGGLKVLLLDAGWQARFKDAPLQRLISATVSGLSNSRLQGVLPPNLLNIGMRALRVTGRLYQPVQSKCFAWGLAPDAFVNDCDSPYISEPGTAFDWFRAWQIGGRMTVPGHGRQYYRFSASHLLPSGADGHGWPLEPGELDRWYDLVEGHLRLSGGTEKSRWVPDSIIGHERKPSPAEAELIDRIVARWNGVGPIVGRSAPPLPAVETAAATGNLFCRQGAVVSEILVDFQRRAIGARWFDRAMLAVREARAPIVFLCASSLESTRILLASRSSANPDGIGASSGALGHYLMDHILVSGGGTDGELPGAPVLAEPGRCVYVPRFDLRDGEPQDETSIRGYGIQLYRWSIGQGSSYFLAVSFGEMVPRIENRVILDPHKRNAFGQPVLRIACTHNADEIKQAADQAAAIRELGTLLGVTFNRIDAAPAPPGTAIHECGTARLGDDPGKSVLDPNNQCWDAKGLYVTDASAFPCQGEHNPTLTILALTARACHKVLGARAASV